MSEHPKLPDIVEEMREQARLGFLVGQKASPILLEKGADEIERLRPRWEEAIEAAAKVADETAALEDKHDRYEAYRAAHDIAQTIRSLPRPSAPAEDGEGLREALTVALNRLEGAAKCFRANNLKGLADNVDLDIRDINEMFALSSGRDGGKT